MLARRVVPPVVVALVVVLVTVVGGAPPAAAAPGPGSSAPQTITMQGHGKVFDVRDLPPPSASRPSARIAVERPDEEDPDIERPAAAPGGPDNVTVPPSAAPAPSTGSSFDGLHFTSTCGAVSCGAGHPPDTNGDVGPNHYIQTINSAVGIYDKATGAQIAAFTFDQLMSQGSFGNVCDTDNFGDPVVLYDTFEDRWLLSDFAFQLDAGGNVLNPPGAFECMAVSKTGDPVSGGWNFYSVNTEGGLGDYPKLGIWPDGIYMSVNMFGYSSTGGYLGPRVYAFDKSQMYAGAPAVQAVSFDGPLDDFTLLPSNARLQSGTPPPGTPNYFVSTWQFLDRLAVYKFHVDWTRPSLSTFTGPQTSLAGSSWPNADTGFAPTPRNSNDTLGIRAMMQNQYSNIAGVESLWDTHTVRRANTTGSAAPRYYQVNVTGGTVAPNLVQAATWDPNAANTFWRYMPSIAVDRLGDVALGYTLSNATTNPSIRYAGRLAGDPVNTFSQTEQVLVNGTGAQLGNCGGSACDRWGDYSAMSLDPDGCTFWYTNEYYVTDGLDHHTRIGSFKYPSCTAVGAGGTVSGTVTSSTGATPIPGATISLGSRTTTTAANGTYSFSVPAGTYPVLTASAPGFGSGSSTSVPVADGATTTRSFSLTPAPASGTFVDTSLADFQTGSGTNVDLGAGPGSVQLSSPDAIDQQNLTVTNSGFSFTSTAWAGQTFTAGASGQLRRVDLDLFCSGCTGTTPNLTVSIRATTGATPVPTGADLATATIPGFSSGSGGFFSATFASPTTVAAGTTYAIVLRATANPSAGTYAYVCSCTSPNSNPYTAGRRVVSSNSGTTWSADTTTGGRDLGFVTYVNSGHSTSGSFVSSVKDVNPAAGVSPAWDTLSWSAVTPAATNVTFQAGASDSPFGPFAFVGPDGTAATTFPLGASLAQFNGKRYLKYRAALTTSNPAVTPSVSDVSIGFHTNPTISIGSVSVLEGDVGTSLATLTATLSAPTSVAVSASWATANGTAAAGSDYNAQSGTVTIPPGKVAVAIRVTVTGEGRIEPNETFTVTLSSPVNAIPGEMTATATILDDDGPANPRLAIGDVSIPETGPGTAAPAFFTVTLDQATATAVSAHWATAPGTAAAASDYFTDSGTVTIPAGASSATVSVQVRGDAAVEADEAFTVTLSSPVGATLARATGTGTIIDDDTAPNPVGLSIGDARMSEGDAGTNTLTFAVRLDQPSAQTVTATYATTPGTATSSDFIAKTGTVTISAGSVAAKVLVSVRADAAAEADETFTVTLSSPANATLVRATGTGTILDDDPPAVVIGIGDTSVVEGNSTNRSVTVLITMSQRADTDITVHVGSAPGTATTSADFTAVNKNVVILAGTTYAAVTVAVRPDLAAEADETFSVLLSAPTSGTLGRATGTVTILDDD